MSWKNVQYGKKRVRRNYARVQTNVDLPNLIEVQTGSFQWLIETGLKELFHEISPIRDHGDGEKFEFHLNPEEVPTYGMCTDLSRFYTFYKGEFYEFYPKNITTENAKRLFF